MEHSIYSFLAISIFSLVHLFSTLIKKVPAIQSKFLSFGGGVAIAYVFIDLMPKLGRSDELVSHALEGVFPYFQRHVFIMALIGFLLFYVVDNSQSILKKNGSYYLSISSYALFNFFVGYAVMDLNDPEVQPLALFTIAMALHYFTNDYSLSKEHGKKYDRFGKWLLIASLFLGGLVGAITSLPKTAVALISAFIGGGVIMNVTRHELPKENPHSMEFFFCGAAVYSIIILSFSR